MADRKELVDEILALDHHISKEQLLKYSLPALTQHLNYLQHRARKEKLLKPGKKENPQ